jgi:hypothetical protein
MTIHAHPFVAAMAVDGNAFDLRQLMPPLCFLLNFMRRFGLP